MILILFSFRSQLRGSKNLLPQSDFTTTVPKVYSHCFSFRNGFLLRDQKPMISLVNLDRRRSNFKLMVWEEFVELDIALETSHGRNYFRNARKLALFVVSPGDRKQMGRVTEACCLTSVFFSRFKPRGLINPLGLWNLRKVLFQILSVCESEEKSSRFVKSEKNPLGLWILRKIL